jgi:hypothetical protein
VEDGSERATQDITGLTGRKKQTPPRFEMKSQPEKSESHSPILCRQTQFDGASRKLPMRLKDWELALAGDFGRARSEYR